MLESYSLLNETVDRLWTPTCRFVHRRLRLTPNQISFIGFAVGMVAAGFIAIGLIEVGMMFMFVSQFLDGLDGSLARKFGPQTSLGEHLEIVFDRGVEFFMFIALAYAGRVSYEDALLAFAAILLLTSLVKRSGVDLGFKRIVLYLGYIIGFPFAVRLALFVNLGGFVLSMLVIDYRNQKETDRIAVEARSKDPQV